MGRPVFAVPGDVDRPASVGCNRLIRDGAHPVLGVDDLITELSLILGPPAPRPSHPTDLPVAGLSLDQLPEYWGCQPAEALARLARLEVSGAAHRSGEIVLPGRG